MLLEARKVDLNLKRLKWFSVKLMVLKKSLKIEKLLAACQSLHGGLCQFHSGMSQLLDGTLYHTFQQCVSHQYANFMPVTLFRGGCFYLSSSFIRNAPEADTTANLC